MAQPTWEGEPSDQNVGVQVVSQERAELYGEDLPDSSESQGHIADGNVKEIETKQNRFMESWLEEGLGNLFEEGQSSKERSTRKSGKSKQAKSRADRELTDDTEEGPSKSKKKKRQASKSAETPDHFIALQISNHKIQKGFTDVQEKIVSQSPPLKDAMVSVQKLHVTVMPVCLPSQDRIDSALDVSAARLSEVYSDRLVVLGVAGLGHFRNNVLFARVTPSDPTQHGVLQHISDVVNDTFAEYEIKNTDKKSDFKPHVTIAKLSKNFRKLRQKGIKKIDPSLYEDEVDRHFGHQVLTTIQLCSMFQQDKTTGYYKILHEASFGPQEISKMTIEEQFSVPSVADILVQWTVRSALERCLAVKQEAGDDTSNIKSGEATSNIKSGEATRNIKSGEASSNIKSGEATSNIKSEENRQPDETEHLTGQCEGEHCTGQEVKLGTESDLCTVLVKDSVVAKRVNNSETNVVDLSISKEEEMRVSANITEGESSPVDSSDVKDCPNNDSKDECSINIIGKENSDSL